MNKKVGKCDDEMKKDLKKYGLGLIPQISKEDFIKKWGMSPSYARFIYNE